MEIAGIELDHVLTVDWSGAEAGTGDIVENAVTGEASIVRATQACGRLVTSIGVWERTSARVRLTRGMRVDIYRSSIADPYVAADERAAMRAHLAALNNR